jgi:diguanylate cyclase (GGDEF)-like protein/PAS domain S-box-containing protein/putative nucleotidyltransferase with HDIG domain
MHSLPSDAASRVPAPGGRTAARTLEWRLAAALVPDPVARLTPVRGPLGTVRDARVAEAGEGLAEVLGVPAVAVGDRLSALLPSEVWTRLQPALGEAAAGTARDVDARLPGAGGERVVRFRVAPLEDGLALVVRDDTAGHRRDVEARLLAEQFRFVARAAADMIAVHGPGGRFRFVSDASRQLVGRDPADLIGHHPLELSPPEDRAGVRMLLRALLQGMPWAGVQTVRVCRPDGSVQVLDVMIRPLRRPGGALEGFISVARDASERLAAERRAARQVAEQRALRQVATAAAAGEGSMRGIGRVLVEQLSALLGTAAVLLSLDSDGGGARVVAAAGRGLRVGPDARVAPPADPAPQDERVVGVHMGDLLAGGEAGIGCGVVVDGRPWGMLVVGVGEGGGARTDAADTLSRFAELSSVAVSAVQARARLAAQALTDPLTGLPNHRAFHERLRAEAARAGRYGRHMSLALFDVDHFKRVNTLHGHLSGDAALVEVARRLATTVRDGEMLARTGGEEFGLILVETPADEALSAVERARARVADGPVVGDLSVTVSAGVCDLHRAGSADELFRLADGALYWAKVSGRDRAVLYSPETVTALSAEERAERLERSQALVALRSLARAVDAKDPSTHAHSERVAELCERIALELGWTVPRAAQLREAALLHDVGKIGVPDAVLLKAGSLTDEEREVVARHAALGAEIADEALSAEQCAWIRGHHERPDGLGYPDRLAGDDVPDGARIIGVADAWDVMTRARHYGTIRPPEDALEELRRHAGAQFSKPAVAALAALLGRERIPLPPL